MDWDDAYANGAHIDGAADFPPRWAQKAQAFRDALGSRYQRMTYGDRPRNVLDVMWPEGLPRGIAVFVHGGYWMKFDGSIWSHLAAGAVSRGWVVAMPTYTLCPEQRISGITEEIVAAVLAAADLADGPVHLSGHSAGGHLVSRMVCQDVAVPTAVTDRTGHVLSISGVHDLRPLRRTAMNDELKLDEIEADRESPVLQTPRDGVRITCWVGAHERPEFVRQNALLANIWTGLGASTSAHVEPGKHHFDVIDALADPNSQMVETWLGGA